MKAWRCILCGYVHRGEAPPETCPVCGAPSTDFEEVIDSPIAPPRASAWRCLDCGYIHEGPEPPAACPLCAAPASRFEPDRPYEPGAPATGSNLCIVILGAGIAGVSAAESARRTAPEARIVLVNGEQDPPYYRMNLTRLLAGDVAEAELALHPSAWYQERRIELLNGVRAADISAGDRRVSLSDGRTIPFDRLVVTAGALAFRPPLPGHEKQGVFTLRSLGDARALLAAVRPGARCVCVGGGLLGLETAGALARRGAAVTLLENHSTLMPRQLNARAGELLGRYVASLGLNLRTQASTRELAGDDRVRQVVLDDGARLEADLVILATGARADTRLARAAGWAVNQGLVVDHALRTSQEGIYAAGDLAEHQGLLYGSWPAAQAQGRIAGANAAGGNEEFHGMPRSHTLKVLGLGVTSLGTFEPANGSFRVLEEEDDGRYQRFVFRDGRLIGAVWLGGTDLAAAASRAIEQAVDYSTLLAGPATARDAADCLREAMN